MVKIKRDNPLFVIEKLVKEQFSEAKAIFWSGSVSKNKGNSHSDLDLVIVYEKLDNSYRKAFFYEQWPVDTFVLDQEMLYFFFEESRTKSGIPGLISMILEGKEITEFSDFSKKIKETAQRILVAGPAIWDKDQIDKERFFITDVLDDIKYPVGFDEQIASAGWLFEALGQFYFRSQNKWCASGKSIIRYLKNDNPDLAIEFTKSFESLFQTGSSMLLELLVKKILEPYGGLFWDGFHSNVPKLK